MCRWTTITIGAATSVGILLTFPAAYSHFVPRLAVENLGLCSSATCLASFTCDISSLAIRVLLFVVTFVGCFVRSSSLRDLLCCALPRHSQQSSSYDSCLASETDHLGIELRGQYSAPSWSCLHGYRRYRTVAGSLVPASASVDFLGDSDELFLSRTIHPYLLA